MAGRGMVWERVCNNSRDRLAQDGRLSWLPMHPPVLKIGAGAVGRRGSFLAVRTGKGPPDWVALSNEISILVTTKVQNPCVGNCLMSINIRRLVLTNGNHKVVSHVFCLDTTITVDG